MYVQWTWIKYKHRIITNEQYIGYKKKCIQFAKNIFKSDILQKANIYHDTMYKRQI